MSRRSRLGTTTIWVDVFKNEQQMLAAIAKREGVTVPQFIRDCVNDRLAEESDDAPLLRLRELGRPKGRVRARPPGGGA